MLPNISIVLCCFLAVYTMAAPTDEGPLNPGNNTIEDPDEMLVHDALYNFTAHFPQEQKRRSFVINATAVLKSACDGTDNDKSEVIDRCSFLLKPNNYHCIEGFVTKRDITFSVFNGCVGWACKKNQDDCKVMLKGAPNYCRYIMKRIKEFGCN